MTENVIDISTRFNEAPPVEVRQGSYADCRHEHTIIDDKLRTVSCADCREERLDPIEVLVHLSRQWRSWQHEAEKLRELNREYRNNQRDAWERARDRHLNAHPDHRASFDAYRTSWGPSYEGCQQCRRLEVRFDRRWYPTPAPEPPPGPLIPTGSGTSHRSNDEEDGIT